MSKPPRPPHLVPVSQREILRSSSGAFLGLLLTSIIAQAALGGGSDLPLLMAPIGASTVLLFAAPASPLAQPWSIIGGNFIAAVVGVTCAHFVPDVTLAAALAVSVSIGLMLACRCLHPPSGAVALTAVIGGPAIAQLGYGFALWPVGINSVALLLLAIGYNRLVGRNYPHRVAQPSPPPAAPTAGVTIADIEAAIRERDEVVSIDPADLEAIVHRAEDLAVSRRSLGTSVAEVMATDIVTVRPGTSLRVLLRTLRHLGAETALVVDAERRLLGSVSQADLLHKAQWGPPLPSSGLGWRLRSLSNSDRPLRGRVGEIMVPATTWVRGTAPVAQAVRLMLLARQSHLPVLDAHDRVIGVVAQADLMHVLFHEAGPQANLAA